MILSMNAKFGHFNIHQILSSQDYVYVYIFIDEVSCVCNGSLLATVQNWHMKLHCKCQQTHVKMPGILLPWIVNRTYIESIPHRVAPGKLILVVNFILTYCHIRSMWTK